MIKKLAKDVMKRLGYEIKRIPKGAINHENFILYQYTDKSGKFDFEKYRSVQNEGNKRKIDQIWAVEGNIKQLSSYIRENRLDPKFGICHGTRRGKEQEWFRKYLGCEVIGTEIADTAHEFPNTIQWDFHKTKDEWIGAVDFIYSNSFDHSHSPEACLKAWMSCLKPGGYCFIEHTILHGPRGASELDPFGADLALMPYLIAIWGKGRFFLKEILDATEDKRPGYQTKFLIIQNYNSLKV